MPTFPLHQGLGGDPPEHFQAVLLLQGEVFVPEHALRLPRAAQIDPDAGVAVAGKITVSNGVADGFKIALSVGDVFQDGRRRLTIGCFRNPDPGRQMGAVGQWNPRMRHFPNRAGKSCNGFHG